MILTRFFAGCLILCSFAPPSEASGSVRLVFDYFTRMREVDHLVFFSCDDVADWRWVRDFNQEFISVLGVPKSSSQSIVEILSYKIVARTGVLIDCDCSEGRQRLFDISTHRYFNTSYSFLFVSEDGDIETLLQPLYNISVNSDITLAEKDCDSENILFYDVFSRGQQIGQPIIADLYGRFNETGFSSIQTAREDRLNFTGVTLRGATVINRPNIFPEDVDKILSSPKIFYGLSNLSKYHYGLYELLKYMYGFNIKYRVTREWTGRTKGNYRLGIMGIVQRGEAECFATGAFHKASRHDEMDISHMSYRFTVGIVYVITPEIAKFSNDLKALTISFAEDVWLAIFICGITFTISFIVLEWSSGIISSSWLHTIATFAQQGLDTITTNYKTKILLFSLSVTAYVLYNIYTSIMVGGLLVSQPRGPGTLKEIIDSPLILSFEDVGYHLSLFRKRVRSGLPIVDEMYKKKMKSLRKPGVLPPFSSMEKALPYLKKGGYAYHSELNLIYPIIAKEFNDQEMCKLRVVQGVWPSLVIMTFVPKRTPYLEMFRIGMLKSCEMGLCKYEARKFEVDAPKCQSNILFDPVILDNVKLAFVILISGILLSTLGIFLEILYWKTKQPRGTLMNVADTHNRRSVRKRRHVRAANVPVLFLN